ncbi:Protein kinase domain-containing protein [Parafrankia irregularis]|uniref:non-specific serine/threonine protein kinase n=1 Tax=Parafrankia irregularis TaxID=795642 RepID=A0A0S4QG69_9ACTN|nr:MULTISPECIES: serine/threonine-protein kinase [Parafrankia]MBE3202937.1 serine/threonine protein kinase [Parafrankia sp. CH37]CUU54435.1 Protein kinase domain-containing protein [Parafrankia irregularis]
MARSASVPPDTSRHGTPRYVAQRYRLDAPIGRGGAGVVWRGEDELLQRPVAIKEILVPMAGAQAERDAIRARVLREARALARLHSPAIVSVFDVVEEHERHWIIMELIDADSLGDTIKNHGPLPFDQVAAIGLALADALAAAHSAGVLHRDVKPGNVLLGRDNRVRLTDFGIAATEGDVTLTGTGALVGSPAYIAPERVRGSSGTPASDLWGLGATLYSAVEGCPPFEGPETYAVLSAVVEGRRRPFRLAGPLRGLLTDLLDRPAELRPDVEEIRRRLTPIARNATPVPAVVTNPRSRPAEPSDDLVASDDGLENLSAPSAPSFPPQGEQQAAPAADIGVTDRLPAGHEITPVPSLPGLPGGDDELTAVGLSPVSGPNPIASTGPHDDLTQIGPLAPAPDLFDQDDANLAAGLLSLDRDAARDRERGDRTGRVPVSHRASSTGRGDHRGETGRGAGSGRRPPLVVIIAGGAAAALAGLAILLTVLLTGGKDPAQGTDVDNVTPSPSATPAQGIFAPATDEATVEPTPTQTRSTYRPRRTTTPTPEATQPPINEPPPETTPPVKVSPPSTPTTTPASTPPVTRSPDAPSTQTGGPTGSPSGTPPPGF